MVSFHIAVIYFALTAVLLLITGLILFVPAIRRNSEMKGAGEIPEKKKLSKMCLAGFIIAALYPLLLAFDHFGLWLIGSATGMTWLYYDRSWLSLAEFLMPLTGIILSIIGIITSGKNGRSGRKLGIAGIVLPVGYVAIVILIVIGNIIILLVHNGNSVRTQKNREVYGMRYVGRTENTEYDVSQYRVPEGFDIGASGINTSEAELKTYAESKLKIIDFLNDRSAKGKFQESDFLIVRSDRLNEWLKVNNLRGFEYRNGRAQLTYDYSWEFAATGYYSLDVYKDPSGKFIIITNCGDQKIIAEFFVGIGEAVPTETVEEETEETESKKSNDPEDFLENNINRDMPLIEIINVFEKMCQPLGKDTVIFRYGNGRLDVYDTSNRSSEYFYFSLAREYQAENGKTYQLRVEVLYGLTAMSRSFENTQLTDRDVNGDIFEYIRNSDAYKYAKTDKIRKILIYKTEIEK